MKKERGIIYTFFVLLLITSIIATIIAFVNSVTAKEIENAEKEKIKDNISSLFPNQSSFEETDFTYEGVSTLYTVNLDNNGKRYCVSLSVNGYGGEINIMVGFTGTEVEGVKILSAASETPGLGARVMENSFLAQFKGTGGEIDGITGATISSTAVTTGVDLACEAINAFLNPVTETTVGGGE